MNTHADLSSPSPVAAPKSVACYTDAQAICRNMIDISPVALRWRRVMAELSLTDCSVQTSNLICSSKRPLFAVRYYSQCY